jgi:magnesium-transporting ATPase (P-type)
MRDEIMAVKEELEEVKEKSFALQLLQDQRKANKRMFIMWLITFVALVGVSVYTVYLLNDIGTIETTTEVDQSNSDGYNNYVGNDGDIINGKTND